MTSVSFSISSARLLSRFVFCAMLFALIFPVIATAQVSVSSPYTLSGFAKGVLGTYTQPDSIAVSSDGIFIGYGNGVCKDGCGVGRSTIVRYSTNCTQNCTPIKTYSVPGHNDGLKIDPKTGLLWALQNEDANPALAIIDPKTGNQRDFTLPTSNHGGGYDDIAFINDDDQEQDNFLGSDAFLSASNPTNNPNTDPAIVRFHLNPDGTVSVTPVLLGTATATDIMTGGSVTLNLLDPDSMIFDPSGDLVLDDQDDAQLIIVQNPGSEDQSVFRLGLTLSQAPETVDDTVFATSSHGVILISDRDAGIGGAGIVYALTKPKFTPGAAYTAASTSVGTLNLRSGVITPVVTGLTSPHGMAFIPH